MMKDFKTILQAVARKNGVSTETVLKEMQEAIDIGFNDPDPEVQAKWREIPRKGDKPTPEDVIMYYATLLKPTTGILQ